MSNIKEQIIKKSKVLGMALSTREIDSIEKRVVAFSGQDLLNAIESAIVSEATNPLVKDNDKMPQNMICAVCGNICEPISLMGNRPAYYCKAHKVVLPRLAQ